MEINDITKLVAEFLIPFLPYLVKTGEGIASEIGKGMGADAWEKAKSLWDRITRKAGEEHRGQDLESMAGQFKKEEKVDPEKHDQLVKLIKEIVGNDQPLLNELRLTYIGNETRIENNKAGIQVLGGGNVTIHNLIWQTPETGRTPISRVEEVYPQAVHEVDQMLAGKMEAEKPLGAKLFHDLLVNSYSTFQSLPHMPHLAPRVQPADAEFYDRQVLMAFIRSRGHSTRVFELNGPSGIGKKHVLLALKEEQDRYATGMNPTQWGKWVYACADGEQHVNYRQIMAAFSNCLGGENHVADPIQGLAICLTRQITQAQPGERISILFLLDNADQLDADDLAKLAGEEGPVGSRIRGLLPVAQEDYFLRLVITSRRPRLTQNFCQQKKLINIRTQSIEPMDEPTVTDMVRKSFYKTTKREIEEQRGSKISQQLVKASGGHPGAIYQIIEQLKSCFFVVDPDSFIEQYRPLIMLLIQRDIIGDLSLKEFLLLNVLSVFRYIHSNLVEELIKRGLLPSDIIPPPDGSQLVPGMWTTKWLNHMCDTTGLLYSSKEGFYQLYRVHPVLRTVLFSDLKNRSLLPLQMLCREAHEIHYHFLTATRNGMPALGMEQWVMAALASIYHLAQGIWILPKEQRDCSELLKHAAEYRQRFIDMLQLLNEDAMISAGNMLYDMWTQDTELQELIRGLTPCDDLNQQLDTQFNLS